MKIIDYSKKLDFDDVLIRPAKSLMASRKEVKLQRKFEFYNSSRIFEHIPIFAANMDTVGTLKMARSLAEHDLCICLNKHLKTDKLIDFFNEYDKNSNRVFYTVGQNEEDLNRYIEVAKNINYWPNICIDAANGHTQTFVDFVKEVRVCFGHQPIIMAGNVAITEMVYDLIEYGGADIVKVGIGPGQVCETRKITGVGYPQLSCISECSNTAHGLKPKPETKKIGLICADGGCKNPGDIAKAFGANADFVMLGSMFAGAAECDGHWEYHQQFGVNHQLGDKKSLKFYGMSSYEAQKKYGGIVEYAASEGRVTTVPYKGPASSIVKEILGGLRSAATYIGCQQLRDFAKCCTFVRIK